MKHSVITYLFVLLAYSASGQIQYGLVREINSGKKPLADVQVVFEGAVPTATATDGRFKLRFLDKKPGSLIFLEQIEKEGYELVNAKDLEVLTISADKQLMRDIILAKEAISMQHEESTTKYLTKPSRRALSEKRNYYASSWQPPNSPNKNTSIASQSYKKPTTNNSKTLMPWHANLPRPTLTTWVTSTKMPWKCSKEEPLTPVRSCSKTQTSSAGQKSAY